MQFKQLPPNPSLEHLKSQAKKLLKAHRQGSVDACHRIRAFFPKLATATEAEIQRAAFGLQDAQLVIAREYRFANWTQLKEEVLSLNRGPDAAPDLFKILRTPVRELVPADIQTVEELLAADPGLITARDERGRTPVQAVAAHKIILPDQHCLPQLYHTLIEHGAKPDIVAAVVMNDVERVEAHIHSHPQVLQQRFDIPGRWRGISLLAIAARYARTETAKVLIEADASLVTAGETQGKAPMDLLVKPWHHSLFEAEYRMDIYNLLVENGATPDLGAAIVMNELGRIQRTLAANPQLLTQPFVCGNQIVLRPVAIAATYGRTESLDFLCSAATEAQIDISKDLAESLVQTFSLEVTESLLATRKLSSASALTDALAFACEVYQPEKVRLLLKYGADPGALVKTKFRYDVVQNQKPSPSEMSPLLIAIGTWYGPRDGGIDECLEILEAFINAGADLHRSYQVDIDGEVLTLTPLTYAQKLAAMFPDKPFDQVIALLAAHV